MPYKARKWDSDRKVSSTRRRKKKGNGKAWYDRRYSARDIAISALKNAQYMKKFLLNTERKLVDYNGTSNITTTPVVLHFTNFSRGDTASTRSGRKVKLVNFDLNMLLYLDASVNSDVVRYMIVQTKTPTAPTGALLLDNVSVIGHRNLGLIRDYKMLVDDTVCLDIDKNNHTVIKHHLVLDNKCIFEEGSDTPEWGHLYMIIFSLTGGGTPTQAEIDSRLRFVDN